MDRHETRRILSILALSLVFFVFGAWEIIDPSYWSAFVPSFISFISPLTLVVLHGIALIGVSLGLFSRKFYKPSAILAFLIMLEIVVDIFISSGFNDLIIRDIGLLILALSLFFDEP